jgi:hypothetical protein
MSVTEVRCPKDGFAMSVALVRGNIGLECTSCGYQHPKVEE